MDVVDRRTFLRRSVIAAAAVGAALEPFRLTGSATASPPDFGELGPVPEAESCCFASAQVVGGLAWAATD